MKGEKKRKMKKQNPTLITFGKRVRRLRKSQGLSQGKLAQKVSLHYTYIGGVERGERNLSLESIQKIAKGLGVDIAEFFPPPETLSPEGRVIDETVNLLRGRKLEVLQLVLGVAKAIIQENTSKGEN